MLAEDEFLQIFGAFFIFVTSFLASLLTWTSLFSRERLLYFHQRLADFVLEVLPDQLRKVDRFQRSLLLLRAVDFGLGGVARPVASVLF